MNGDRIRLSPVVAGFMIAMAAAGILLATVLTLPAVSESLRFDPTLAFRRPWTFITYLFVHPGLIALGFNLILLAGFGPPVERRVGKTSFLLYYLACGLGTALFALGLTSFVKVEPLLGSNGAVLGLALAFWFIWPDARLVLDPIPLQPRVRTLVILLATLEVAAALLIERGSAHLAHLGGFATGYLIFRVQALRSRRSRVAQAPLPARPLLTAVSARQGAPAQRARPATVAQESSPPRQDEELDRILDKISGSGMESLTAEERQFLDRISERKRTDPS